MKLSTSSVARVVKDFKGAKLGDPRREKRLIRMVAKMARMPSAPLPVALGNPADLEAGYRFANNRHVSFEDLVSAHAKATARRAEASGEVLVVHDTTDASFPHLDPEEIGYLQTGKAGFKIHVSLVLDANQWCRPLGVIHAETIHRTERSKRAPGKKSRTTKSLGTTKKSAKRPSKAGRGKAGKKVKVSGVKTATWKDREFKRWWRGALSAAQQLQKCRRVTHVADRETDSYELMAYLIVAAQDFVVRSRTDRRARRAGDESGTWSKLSDLVAQCEGILERDVPLSRRTKRGAPGMNGAHPPRKMRMATLTFSAIAVEIPRPRYCDPSLPATLRLHLVHVLERNPPPGEPPVEWLLYTTRPIDTTKQVETVVDIYRARWAIEEFNSGLKTGCAYEARQFETRHALLTMLALSLPIACEVLWLRSRARSSPEAPATEVLTTLQLRILRKLGPRPMPPEPTARDALLALAALGGHQRSNGEPGWKILQRGMTLLLHYEKAWIAARQSSPRRTKM